MNTTESNIICTGCDAPFLPNKTDLCQRCEQRQSDKLDGLAAGAGICISVVGLIIALMAAAASCRGADTTTYIDSKTGLTYFWQDIKPSDFRTKHTEGKVRHHEVVTTHTGAPAIHSAGAPSVVDDALLNRVAWVESRNNPKAVGKLGEIGMFQLRPIAIREVNRVYGTKYHILDARKMVESRQIARLYLLICESRCRVKTPANVYAKYRGAR